MVNRLRYLRDWKRRKRKADGILPARGWVRFWALVDMAGDCWEWLGFHDPDGYAKFTMYYRNWRAARLVYTRDVGRIPAGMTIDHLCYNPGCVRPSHLEVVTIQENLARRRTYA